LVTNDNNELLLIKKKINDYWERPGGSVEVNELLEDCVVREVKEETNIKTKVVNFIMLEQLFFGADKKHWLSFCYHLKYVSGSINNNKPEKHDEVRWFKLAHLPKNLSPHAKIAIEKYGIIVK